MATSSSTSASLIEPSPREAMNASTATSPKPAASQKPREGDSPARSTANTAVQAGSSAITTAPWVASTWRSASAVKSGKAATTPNAMIASERHWAPRGRGARSARSTAAPSTAATTARPKATNSRVEVGDREPGGREGEGEDRDAERGEREAAQLRAAGVLGGRCRYRSAADNVTLGAHDLE